MTADSQTLGATILLVEDEVILAMDMKDMIERLGYRVLGPAADVARAHVVLDRERPDAGVLDLNLKGEAVTPLAERLRLDGVPCGLVTAYRTAVIADARLATLPPLATPVDEASVGRLIEALLKQRRGGPSSAPH